MKKAKSDAIDNAIRELQNHPGITVSSDAEHFFRLRVLKCLKEMMVTADERFWICWAISLSSAIIFAAAVVTTGLWLIFWRS